MSEQDIFGKFVNLKDKIDQIPYLGMEKEEFERQAISMGYKCEFANGAVTLQARADNELIIWTENNKVKIIS